MNYFNYYTEIEDEFVRRRGKHLIVSSLDWALIDSWKQREVPLHVVLRGINNTFDAYDKRPHRDRRVSTLFFCQQEVEGLYREYLASRVGGRAEEAEGDRSDEAGSGGDGASGAPDAPFGTAEVRDYLEERHSVLNALANEADGPTREVLLRSAERLRQVIDDFVTAARVSYESLEADLTIIENRLCAELREEVDRAKLAGWEKDGKRLLRAYRETMTPEAYQQTVDNYLARRLREEYRLPRLSLFYLNL